MYKIYYKTHVNCGLKNIVHWNQILLAPDFVPILHILHASAYMLNDVFSYIKST